MSVRKRGIFIVGLLVFCFFAIFVNAGLDYENFADGKIKISWDAVFNADKLYVDVFIDGAANWKVAVLDGGDTSYVYTGAVEGSGYKFQVRKVQNLGGGDFMSVGTLTGEEFVYFSNGESGHVCGDGIIEGTEACDGSNLNSESCVSLGYDEGVLKCSECSFDVSDCRVYSCDNNIVDPGEVCDGTNLGGKTCKHFKDDNDEYYVGGTLICKGDCTDFITSGCESAEVIVPPPAEPAECGDGVIEDEEECDDGGSISGDGCDISCGLEAPVIIKSVVDLGDGVVLIKWKPYDDLFSNGGVISGNVVMKHITGGAVSGESEGFFSKIMNFFKWLFGARVVGVELGDNGYVVYRRMFGEDWEKIDFVNADSCDGDCVYSDDIYGLEAGNYDYSVSVIFNGVESIKSDSKSVNVPEFMDILKISPSGDIFLKVDDSQEFKASGGAGGYVWEVEGDCGSIQEISEGVLFIAEDEDECRVKVTDGLDDSEVSGLISVSLPIVKSGGSNAPVLNPSGIGNKIAEKGKKLYVDLRGVDADGGELLYKVEMLNVQNWRKLALPASVDFDSSSGDFEWDTSDINEGNYIFNFSVTDGIFIDDEIVWIAVYEKGANFCEHDGSFAPKGACFERKPFYCDPVYDVRYNCTDCGCPKSENYNYVCEANGRCEVAYDCEDNDGDGVYGKSDYCAAGADCDDSDANVNPSAAEICNDGIDNDCDGETDEEDCLGGEE